jgi:hypothetical protein
VNIRDRIRETPQQIRVVCPHGHFIADVWLEVPDGDADVALWPRGPQKQSTFDRHAGFYGFWMSLAAQRIRRKEHPVQAVSVRLKCTNSRCRYTGKFGYTSLAVELAAAALAGQSEYRLTT